VSELKFRTLAEKSMVGVYISQKERFTYVNPRFAEIFGYEPHELINTSESTINIIISKEGQAIVRENVEARYKGEIDNLHYEVKGMKKDGTFNYVEFYGSRIIIDGEPTIIGSMLDITERKRAEEILKRSKANLKTILNTTDTAYVLLDKKLNVIAFNQMAVKFAKSQFNYVPSNGDQLADYIPKDKYPRFLKYTEKVLKGRSISYEINYPQPDGSVFWYDMRLFPITNDKIEIFGLMLAISDITERKNAEESLKSAYNLIQDHINSIKDMAWKQSHLIRSPVANLKGLIALLKEDPSDNELLKFINIELDRLDSVIIGMAEDASNHD
jgi:two-component system, sporulation sensor kinase E